MKTVAPPAPDEIEDKTISIRAFAQSPFQKKKRPSKQGIQRRSPQPSKWVLILDAETTTDPGQSLRFGTYQVRKGQLLYESGIFYEQTALTGGELMTLTCYAEENQLQPITREEFIDTVFYRYGYELNGTTVGFNLPFDISRVAIGHSSASQAPLFVAHHA
jgi:hypothetical protein